MTASIVAWLATHQGPLAYVVIGLVTLIEYLFPPFPGDAVTIAVICGGTAAGFSPPLVFLALNLGAAVGMMLSYGAGRYALSHRIALLETDNAKQMLKRTEALFAKYGVMIIATNRFMPALRSLFFVAAGLARMNPLAVLAWGSVSALAWNAALFGIGTLAGNDLELLERWARQLGLGGAAFVVAVGAGVWFWHRTRKRRDP